MNRHGEIMPNLLHSRRTQKITIYMQCDDQKKSKNNSAFFDMSKNGNKFTIDVAENYL